MAGLPAPLAILVSLPLRFLPLPASGLAPFLRPDRLFRRRRPGVRAVLAQPAFQLRDPQLQPPVPLQRSIQLRPQHRVLSVLRRHHSPQPGQQDTLLHGAGRRIRHIGHKPRSCSTSTTGSSTCAVCHANLAPVTDTGAGSQGLTQRPGYPGLVRRAVTLLTTALIGASLAACSGAPARPEHPAPGPATSSVLSLSCSDSACQQGSDHGTVIGGVEGLALPGSGDPAGLYPIGTTRGSKRYFIYKAFLAVSASAAPFATVSITRPAGARLVYGSPSRIGELFSTRSGQALLAASRNTVRLPVCGPRFTGFTGGSSSPGRLRHLPGLLATRAKSDRHRPDRSGPVLNPAPGTRARSGNRHRY